MLGTDPWVPSATLSFRHAVVDALADAGEKSRSRGGQAQIKAGNDVIPHCEHL